MKKFAKSVLMGLLLFAAAYCAVMTVITFPN